MEFTHFIVDIGNSVTKHPDSRAFRWSENCSASSHYSHIADFCLPNSHHVSKTAKIKKKLLFLLPSVVSQSGFGRQSCVRMSRFYLKCLWTGLSLCNKRFGSLLIALGVCLSCLGRLGFGGGCFQLRRWVVCGFVEIDFEAFLSCIAWLALKDNDFPVQINSVCFSEGFVCFC